MTSANLPDKLQPTAADIARDRELAAEADSILGEISAAGGPGLKINDTGYQSVSFGPDGQVIARTVNGVPQQTRSEEAVARAQSAANAEVIDMEKRLQKLLHDRDEFTGYDKEGKPRYVLPEAARQSLDKQARALRLGIANQKRLNERRWRNEAAPYLLSEEQDRITAAELAKELEARGRVTRVQRW